MNYESEFLRLTSLCASRMSNGNLNLSVLNSDLVQAETCLRQLKIESGYLPVYQRQEVMHRCVKYHSDINNIKKQLRDIEQDKLFGIKVQEKVSSSTALLAKQGTTLELGKKLSLESEAIAAGTMEALRNQRNQLNKAANGSKEIAGNLTKSNKLISAIQRRAVTNKLIMLCIIFLLITAIIMIAGLKIFY